MAELVNGAVHGEGVGFIPFIVDLSGDGHDVPIEMSTQIHFNNTSGASVDVTGLQMNGYDGEIMHAVQVVCRSSDQIIIKNNDVNSAIGNRFFTRDGQNLTMNQFDMTWFYYIDFDGVQGWKQGS